MLIQSELLIFAILLAVYSANALVTAAIDIAKRFSIPEFIIGALTANTMKAEIHKCYASGMNDYISKPCSITDLKLVLSRYYSE